MNNAVVKSYIQDKAIATGHETPEQELARLRSENEALRLSRTGDRRLSLKVSAKGALSVYGMGRFPVTLYRSQWEKLMAAKPEIDAFLKANQSVLKEKV